MDLTSIKNISVFGSGLMGSGISQVFASNGYQVTAYDVDPEQDEAMRGRIRSNLGIMLADQSDKDQRIEQILGRIIFTTDLQSAAESADFVVECVPENMDLKQEVFSALDSICRSDVPLASNTSVMSITEIGSKCEGKQRIIGTHFWNPPYLLPLVETVKTEHTSEQVVELTMQLLKKVGKHPILVKKDVPGFVANRLQHALWREAVSIVENGIADAQTVDDAIKYSFGSRLPVLAPLENSDMVGTDLVLSIHQYVLPHLESSPHPSPYLEKLVESGKLGFKTGEGFMKWSEKEKEALQSTLIKHLVNAAAEKE
jgi:3-hydroxybutyryl-CoA dehydrogenase